MRMPANNPSGTLVVSTSSASIARSRNLPKRTSAPFRCRPQSRGSLHCASRRPQTCIGEGRFLPGIALRSMLLVAATLMLAAAKPLTMAEVIAQSTPADWRALDPQRTLYLELPAGRVIIELAPDFA